jgi:hypothetical protein
MKAPKEKLASSSLHAHCAVGLAWEPRRVDVHALSGGYGCVCCSLLWLYLFSACSSLWLYDACVRVPNLAHRCKSVAVGQTVSVSQPSLALRHSDSREGFEKWKRNSNYPKGTGFFSDSILQSLKM